MRGTRGASGGARAVRAPVRLAARVARTGIRDAGCGCAFVAVVYLNIYTGCTPTVHNFIAAGDVSAPNGVWNGEVHYNADETRNVSDSILASTIWADHRIRYRYVYFMLTLVLATFS